MKNELNNSKTINSWAMFDWANSSYNLTIGSAIFPIYYPIAAIALGSVNPELIPIFGKLIPNSALYSYTLGLAFFILALLMPLLSGISDYKGNKKTFMVFFVLIGVTSCMSLYFFEIGAYWIGIVGFLFSTLGYGGSLVFYNSYLIEIASPDKYDMISAKGFSLGYIGSVILLIFNLSMFSFPEWYGNISGEEASRISFFSVGIWWFLFSIPAIINLPQSKIKNSGNDSTFLQGYKELKHIFIRIKKNQTIKRFLLSFFFYNMAAQTVMYLGALFGSVELKLESDALIITILLIQLVAIPGAYTCAYISKKYGNVKSIMYIISFWIIVCSYGYFVYDKLNFMILASLIGFVMGGIQANSRSTYAKLFPQEEKDTASFFSFYDVIDRTSTFIGTTVFGIIIQFTGNMRNGLIFLIILFIISLFAMNNLKKVKPRELESI